MRHLWSTALFENAPAMDWSSSFLSVEMRIFLNTWSGPDSAGASKLP
jgi:hypothetical protein